VRERFLERAAELFRRGLAARREAAGDAQIPAARGRQFRLDFGGALRRILQRAQLSPQLAGACEDVGERGSVFLLQPFERRQPILDLLKTRGGRVDIEGVGPEKEREILELRLQRIARVKVRREPRVHGRQLTDFLPDDAERPQRRFVTLVKSRVRFAAQALQPVRVGQHLTRRRQLLVLPRLRFDAVDLGELERQEFRARRLLLLARREPLPLLTKLLPLAERVRDRSAHRRQGGEFVEDVEVGGRIEQELVLVLSVQIDQRASGVAQRGAGDERAVHEGAAPSLRRHLAAHDHLASVGGLENGLDGGRLFARPDEVGGRAPSHPQPDSPHQDRLAGSRLAGEHVETGRKLQLEPIDHGETADAQEAKHGAEVPSYQMFDDGLKRVLRCQRLRCPSGALLHVRVGPPLAVRPMSTIRPEENRLRMLGGFALALQAPGASQPETGTGGVDFLQLLAHSTLLAKSVLLILLLFSAVSWAIILYKIWQYRGAARHTDTFLQVFRKSSKFSEVQAVCPTVKNSPLVGIFQSSYAELNSQPRQ